LLAVVGGSKVSTKLDLLTNLCRKVDHIFIGGAMAHTFWVAMGYGIGKSVHEPNYVTTASEILKHYGTKIHLPQDCMVAESLENPEKIYSVSPHAIPAHMSVFDVGPHTVEVMGSFLQQVKTVVWNGPVGAFEFPPFHEGSMSLARVVGALTEKKILQSIAGGGDTLAALEMAGVKDQFTYLSTAGGAFLEWLEGKKLPGVAALQV
jgi:phosphoglycerate kinase